MLIPLLLLTACGQTSKPAAAGVKMGYCGLKAQVKPAYVVVTCENDAITATKLKWSSWGKPTASAKGSALVDLCIYAYMDCATGDYTSVPIVVFASKIERCPRNIHAYSMLRYTFPHGSPWGHASKAAQRNQWMPAEQLPPADQKVSLTC